MGVETLGAGSPKRAGGERFFALKDVPGNAVLARDLHTEDGSLFMVRRTLLTAQIVSILTFLESRNVLALEPGPEGGLGLYVTIGVEPRAAERRAAAPITTASKPPIPPTGVPMGADERRIRPSDVHPGAVLTRDIYTADGRLYLQSGAKLSERMVSIIQDLDQLGHMNPELWIKA